MSRLANRLSEDLHEIAEHATPSSTALATIRARVDRSVDAPDLEVIMLDQNTETPTRRLFDWRLVAAAAAIIAVVVGALVLVSDDNAADTDVASLPDLALEVADDYFEAYNSGDADAVFELFAPDIQFDDNFELQPSNQEEWAKVMRWSIAQGTTMTTPECRVADEIPAMQATVSCSTTFIDAIVRAAKSPPVKGIVTMEVTPAGVTDHFVTFGSTDFADVGELFSTLELRERPDDPVVDFLHAGERFTRWVEREHPDATDALFPNLSTEIEEVEEAGRFRAEVAQEWADYLEETGCAYDALDC